MCDEQMTGLSCRLCEGRHVVCSSTLHTACHILHNGGNLQQRNKGACFVKQEDEVEIHPHGWHDRT